MADFRTPPFSPTILLVQDSSVVNLGGTSAAAVPGTILKAVTIPAGLMGGNGTIEVTAIVRQTGANGSKRTSLAAGGQLLFTYADASAQDRVIRLLIYTRNSSQSVYASLENELLTFGGKGSGEDEGVNLVSFDTTLDFNILLRGSLSNGLDTVSVQLWTVVLRRL